MNNALLAAVDLLCCHDDPIEWCPHCDRLVSAPLMVWLFDTQRQCYECAGIKRPWHNWIEFETKRR